MGGLEVIPTIHKIHFRRKCTSRAYLALVVLLLAPGARAQPLTAFADGGRAVIDRDARPRKVFFYAKNFSKLKTIELAAKETGVSTVNAEANLASLAYIDPDGVRRLAIWASDGRLV